MTIGRQEGPSYGLRASKTLPWAQGREGGPWRESPGTADSPGQGAQLWRASGD